MSTDVDKLAGKLGELQAERAGLAIVRTRDDAEAAAKGYAAAVRRTHADLGGYILGGVIAGDPLASVMHAYIVNQPTFEAWLAEQAKAVCDQVSDRQKSQRLAKLDEQIAKATAELREARKAEAFEQIEREFATSGEAA